MRGGLSRRQEEGTNVKATKPSGVGGGTPVSHTISLGIVIFLVVFEHNDGQDKKFQFELLFFFFCRLVRK